MGSADLSPRPTTSFVTATSLGLSSLLEGDRAVKLAPTDDDCYADAINRSDAETILSRDWLSPVEPGSYIARQLLGGEQPFAIGLATDRLVERELLATRAGIFSVCAKMAHLQEFLECLEVFGDERPGVDRCLELWADDACRASSRSGGQLFSAAVRSSSNAVPPPRTSTSALYSRHLNGYFLVGGKTDNGVELGDVWFHPLQQGDWAEITPTAPLGRVLAATYSFGDGRLWIVDELQTGGHSNARLLAVSLAGEVEVVFRARALLPGSTPYLSVDNDGTILLAVAEPDVYRVYRVATTPCRTLERMRGGRGHLVRPVVVDESGYSFILDGANQTLRLERRWFADAEHEDRDLDDDRRTCWPPAKRRNDARKERCADRGRRNACDHDDEFEFGRAF